MGAPHSFASSRADRDLAPDRKPSKISSIDFHCTFTMSASALIASQKSHWFPPTSRATMYSSSHIPVDRKSAILMNRQTLICEVFLKVCAAFHLRYPPSG